MRKYSTRTEIQVLGSICNSDIEDRRYKYLAQVKPEMFGSASSLEIYNRINRMMQDGQKIPSFEALADDPRISQAARQILAQARNMRFKNEADFNQGLKVLAAHFKGRQLLELQNKLAEVLSKEDVTDNFEDTEASLEETLFKMRADGVEEKIWTGGVGKTEMYDLAKQALMHASTGRRFKTGWGEFDDQIGGLEPGNVMLMTANTGGGKSVAALTMMSNMFRGHNLNVTYISLEMSEREVMERFLANTTGMEYSRIRKGQLTKEEKVDLMRQFKRFNDSSTGSYRIYSPKQDYTIEQLLNQVQSAKTDVIVLDYLGLVKPGNYGKNASEEFQLRQMTRYAKRMAERMGCAIVLLAQLNDEGQIMYSKGIGHHVHYWLKWFCRDEDLQRGFVVVENGKSRNAEKKDLYFTTDFAHMRMDCVANPPGLEELKQEKRSEGAGIKQSGNRRPGMPPKAPPKPTSTNIEINLFDTVNP